MPRRGAPSIKLIDCDNLLPAGSRLAKVLGTPWFIAPEVLTENRPPDQLSDAWSLAVLLYHLLVLTHPLLGDAVRVGPPRLEEDALKGALPWVDHPDDHRNRSSAGMERTLVLTQGLRRAFQRTFGEGLGEPTARPAEGDWQDLLGTARDSLIRCGSCGFEYYFQRACPVCSERRPAIPFLVLQRGRVPGSDRPETRPVVVNSPVGLRARHLSFEATASDLAILVEARPDGDGLRLRNRSTDTLQIGAPGGRRVDLVPPGARACMERGSWLRLGDHGVRAELRR